MQALGVRPIAANVVDFGPAALSRLEKAYNRESEARQEMEAIARANYEAQAQTHAAVLDLLEARNNADLARRLEEAAQVRFGLSAASLLCERAPLAGWRRLDDGEVDELIGEDFDRRLGPAQDCDRLFDADIGPIGSTALVRLALWRDGQPGLLALGAESDDVFTPDMGSELIVFLAGVVERISDRWPPVL